MEFSGYLNRLRRARQGLDLPEGWVPNTFLIAAIGNQVVGRLSLRYGLNEFLRNHGGHVGFGVVASCRRKGYGTEVLRQTLPVARNEGIKRLITCDDLNVAD